MAVVVSLVYRRFVMMLMVLVALCCFSDCYDPLDPNGNVTVTFDILKWTDDGYVARVTIQNYYQYRHVDKPGWQLGWTWTNNEIIRSMNGGFATQQGDCSSFKDPIPHCCKIDPTIADLTPDSSPENMSEDCCHSGVLAAWAINPLKSFTSFEITVGNLGGNSTYKPTNLTLLAPGPGYTCSSIEDTDPTVSSVIGGRREEQVFKTWKSTCMYSNFVANEKPICCVSLSTFYSPTITSCPSCSCGCKGADHNTTCIQKGDDLSKSNITIGPDAVECTDHMCPLRVHWHIKNNYKEHWRVKLTVSNYNYGRNYTDWNVVLQHPAFSQSAKTYSFNSTVLSTVGVPGRFYLNDSSPEAKVFYQNQGHIILNQRSRFTTLFFLRNGNFADDVSLYWGRVNYNIDLLQADEKQVGSVATEILLSKDSDEFTFSNGWAFPRRIYFNGENCEMPLPDNFPMLPNDSSLREPTSPHFLLVFLLYLAFMIPFHLF